MSEDAVQYRDWGERCPRWSGIRSETLEVDGSRVHLLRADAGRGARHDAPTQLLMHGAAGSSTVWLDAIGRLASVGPVVAPDRPGSIFGETATSRARRARLEASVVLLDRLTATLGLDRVALHGLSMGGMAGLLFAAEHGRVERLVLVNSLLPAAMGGIEWFAWRAASFQAELLGSLARRGHAAQEGHRRFQGAARPNNRRDMHVALFADESDPQGSAELYLSAGGNGAASFGVLEEGAFTGDIDEGFNIDPDTLEYVASLSITPDNRNPRFHDVSLDRDGLHFGG